MDDIRFFIKRVAPKDSIKLYIKYHDTHTAYKYKYYDFILNFKEFINYEEDDSKIELTFNDITYDNYIDIQLILFDLFEYKTIEYIDIYLQKQIEKTKLIIEDIYNDYYDDVADKLICTRLLSLDNNQIIKLKFIVFEKTEIKLYYNNDVIIDFDNIIKKINEIISLYKL
jgi:hypothetical protein